MMYCPKCGAQNPDGSRFCGSCGMTFGATQTSAGGQGGMGVPAAPCPAALVARP